MVIPSLPYSKHLQVMERSCSQLLILFTLVNIWFLVISANTRRSIADDQFALLSFKAHITSNNILANSWSSNTSPCKWTGVSCSVRHQRVTALNLTNMGLKGTISPSLGNLSFLTSLDVSFNSFYGILPKELAHLRRLKFMRLQNNNFTGEVPSWFGELQELEQLILTHNTFTGSLPTSIGNIQRLKILDLSYNYLGGQIPAEIGNLSSLKILYLGNNQLSGSIPSVIFNNMSLLTDIDLSYNNLSDNLPLDFCKNVPNLVWMSLSTNQLSGKIPPKYLYKCKELQVLVLSKNRFSGSIPSEIGNLTMLNNLKLGKNNFEGTLPAEIGNLNNLETIVLHNNNLTGLIPSRIFNISTMKVMDLGSNHFTNHLPSTLWLPNLEEIHLNNNTLIGPIPSSISNSSKLTILDIGFNNFTGFIPNTLGNLRLLEILYLPSTELTVESSTEFFTSLANCRALRVLSVFQNPINGILPASIGNLSTSLQELYVGASKIKGLIPNEIGNLRNLQILILRSTELTGPIPATIGRLKHLKALDLSDNGLQGSISEDFCQLREIIELYLGENRLNGSIPECIGELKSLNRVYLNSNKLTSTIPSTFWSLNNLLFLDLSSNFLSGNLSSDIGNMKFTIEMDLSWNQLSGDIPSTIGDVQMLSFLSLAHNRIQGSIPETFGKLLSLEYLDLSNNNLSGVIPKSLEVLRYLQYLNVSFNRLHGEIPIGGNFVNFPAESFMGNDAFCGPTQLQVPPCKTETHRRSMSNMVLFLKYILPPIASVILLSALIILLKRRQNKNFPVHTQSESLIISWRRVSYNEIVRATESFSESNLLGTGSFGSVYNGVLSDGMNVAVKVFNMQLEGTIKSFNVECDVLRKVRHRNLVSIISSCTNIDFMALVLEYMPNASLEKWLYSHNYFLDIFQRLNIMINVASALEYLHHGQRTPIVHCDLKPSNILLGEDMIAHVSDFGISKLLGEDEFIAQTTTLATIGYMAPEYGGEGIISTKGDVYSYGILLMETFTRKKPTDKMFSSDMSMRNWVNDALHGSLFQVVDTNLLTGEEEHLPAKKQCMSSIFALALDCSTDSHVERISMDEVVVRLQKIKIMLQESTERESSYKMKV